MGNHMREKTEQKRKRGRPALGDDARILYLTLRVSRNEIAAWKERADHEGVTVRDYLLAPHRRTLKRKGTTS